MFTKKFAKNCAVLVLSAFGVLGIASCGTNNGDNGGNTPDIETPETSFTVKFMVQDDKNAWTVLLDKKVTDGKVELPTAPAKKYYTFAGWYTTEALTEEFNENSVKANANAYAKYIPQEVKVHINDDPVATKNLVDVVNAVYNPGEGLDFDGWYKDANYSVKWNGTDVVKDLYAKSVALVTFNNGYEDVYTMAVKPGTVVANPAETEVEIAPEATAAEGAETTKTTLEAKEIVESYMDPLDIHYVNADGTAYDFTKPVTKSTTITVNWNSFGIGSSLQYWKNTDTYYIEIGSFRDVVKNAPVISITGSVTQKAGQKVFGDKGNAPIVDKDTVRTIEAVSVGGANVIPAKTEKMIFGEGIRFLGGFNADGPTSVKDIVLPKSLEVIDNSFSNLPKLTGVTLPEGLEVIIGSFFKERYDLADYKTLSLGSNYDFDIEVPASVKNIAMAPNNLKFAEGSKFYKGEDNRIYLKDERGLILISDAENVQNQTIVVPEGVEGIQVGTYESQFNYLHLPESFKFVNHNENIADYPYCYYLSESGSSFSISYNHFFDNQNSYSPYPAMSPYSVSITSKVSGAKNLDFSTWQPDGQKGAGIITFKGEIPANLHPYAFTGDATGFAFISGACVPMTDPALANYIVAKDDVENIYVTLVFDRGLDMDDDPETAPEIFKFNANAKIATKEIANIDELIAEVKAQNPEQVKFIDPAIEGKTFELLNGKDVITVDKIKGEMFLTINVK